MSKRGRSLSNFRIFIITSTLLLAPSILGLTIFVKDFTRNQTKIESHDTTPTIQSDTTTLKRHTEREDIPSSLLTDTKSLF